MMGESMQYDGAGLMEPLRLSTGNLRIEWRRTPEGASEQIAVRRGDRWIELARSDANRPGIQSLVFAAVTAGSLCEIPVIP
ncbi:MAG: hypothetical protein ACRDG4_02735, partial [Chloroflexota bacterium]